MPHRLTPLASALMLLGLGPSPLLAADPAEEDAVDTISVTASRVERGTKEVAGSIEVIDNERIEAARMMNVKEAIQGTPGVLIDSKNGGYDVRLIIRGAGQKANYGVREIMVLRDGVPMTDPDSFSRFDFIDTQDIERIEITKGPGSLYGGGSAGGTVQIISKSVFDTDTSRVRVGIGEDGARNLHARYATDLDENRAVSITASRRELDSSWRDWNEFESNQLSVKFGQILGDGSIWESELSYSEADIQLPASMTEEEFQAFEESGEQRNTSSPWQHSGRYSKIWFFNSRLEKAWGDLTFKPRIYWNRWEHFHPVTGVINDNPGTNVYGTDLELDWAHQIGMPARLVAGVTARIDDTAESRKYEYADTVFNPRSGRLSSVTSDRKGALLEEGDATNTLYGLYLQETLQPSERLSIDLGMRVDRSRFDLHTMEYGEYNWGGANYTRFDTPRPVNTDKTFDLLSPRIGATWALNERINLYGLLAQSQQVPSESEIRDNPGLDAATARNLEIGLKGRSRDWSFDLALYRTTVEDDVVSIINGYVTEFENAGKTLKKGLELNARVRLLDHLWFGAGYAYSDYTFEEFLEPVTGVGNLDRAGNEIPFIPRHQYSLSLDWEHPSGWKARLQADSWGEYWMDNANTERYAGYDFLTSLMVGYEQGLHSINLNVENLFDKRYAVEVKKDVRGTKTYYAGAPRSAMLTYTYTF